MADANATPPAQQQQRYRVHFEEVWTFWVDVLAQDKDEATALAAEFESDFHSEPRCDFCDPVEVEEVPEDNRRFFPANSCEKCGSRIESREYPHCTACTQLTQQSHGKGA